jgi:subtilisin family serine protease
MMSDRDDSQGRPRRRQPGRAGRRSRAPRLRPELAALEGRTLLSVAQAIDLGDSYNAGGTPVPLLRATDQVVVGLAPGADASVVAASLTAPGGPLEGFSASATSDGKVVIATAGAPLAGTPQGQLAQLDGKIAQVQGAPGVAFATEAFQVAGTSDPSGRVWATRDVIVRLAPGVTPQQAFGGPSFASYRRLDGTTDQYVATTTAAAGAPTIALSRQLARDPHFLWAGPDFYRDFRPAGLDDPLLSQQQNLALADVPAAWDLGYDGTGIVIASIDTGVQQDHPDLTYWTNPGEVSNDGLDNDGNGWADDLHGWNFVGNNTNLGPIGGQGHGTAVAGVMAETGGNGIGGAGVAYHAQLMTLPAIATATESQLASAIYYAAGRTADGQGTWKGADIINNSWVLSGDSPVIDTAFDWAATFGRGGKGTILIAATGNSGAGTIANPASLATTIAVGASDATDHRASYSQYGNGLDLVAPVVASEPSTQLGGGYGATGTGTSYAAPMVSGVAALMLQANPDLTAGQVRQILRDTAAKVGGVTYTNGFNQQYGYGRVDAAAALQKILTAITVSPRSPMTLFEGQTNNGLALADFAFYKPLVPSGAISDYSATVDPGDGSAPLPGTIVDHGDGTYTVQADGLTYNAGGTYHLTVSIYRSGVLQATGTDTINVVHQVDAQLVAFSPIEGTLFNGTVAHFTTSSGATASEFTAVITWGNGAQSPGLVAADLINGGFTISGSNRYLHEGTLPFTVTLKDLGTTLDLGDALTGSVTVLDAPISAKATTIAKVEGFQFSGVVATFADSNTFGRLADYGATIDWGDGSPTDTATISSNGQLGWNVSGSHTYRLFGNYTVVVKITGGSTSKAQADTAAKISDAPIVLSPAPTLNIVEGVDVPNAGEPAVVATFTDGNPLGQAGDFVATIDWGDGSGAVAAIVKPQAGGFAVVPAAAHHYRFGQYPIAVTVTSSKAGGVSQATSTAASVSDAAIAASSPYDQAHPLPAWEGQALTDSVVLATFTDANPYAGHPLNADLTPSWGDGSVTIDWGDGSPTQAGKVVYDPSTQVYSVTGAGKVYDFGTYTATISIIGNGGARASATAVVNARNEPLAVQTQDIGVVSEGTQFSGVVGTFADPNQNSTATNFQATIDWGGGHTSVGTILQVGPGQFEVRATRAFSAIGPQSFGVSVTDKAAKATFAAPTAGHYTVQDAPIASAKGAGTITAAEGFPVSATVATFVDPNASGQPSDWTATIDWGDGHTSTGTVGRALGGAFGVSGTHQFAVSPPGQPYDVKVTISSLADASNQATVHTAVNVPNGALSIQGLNQQVTQGKPLSGVLATFGDANTSQAASAYSVSIAWGDGTPAQPGRLVARGGGQFSVEALGAHAYARAGTFPIHVTVSDGQGGTVTSAAEVEVANAPLTSSLAGFDATARTPFRGVVANFADANALASPGSYSATIDWGDGSKSPGTVRPNGDGTYRVEGGHTFDRSGTFHVTVAISDGEGGATSAFGPVDVAVRITQVAGRLDPADDHGPSNSDGITNVPAPHFSGTAGPGDTVTLYAVRGDLPFPLVVGSAKADAATGAWSIASVPLGDGVYTMLALATDDAGRPSSGLGVIAASPGGQLVIDTQAPTVTAAALDPRAGNLYLTIQDNLVGLDQAGLANLAHYGLAQSGRAGATPIPLVGIAATPGAYHTPQTVTLQAGRKLGGGGYVVSIQGAGVTDLAGNALDGGFFTPQPGTAPGAAFVARLNTDGSVASGPVLPSVAARSLGRRATPTSRFNRRGG